MIGHPPQVAPPAAPATPPHVRWEGGPAVGRWSPLLVVLLVFGAYVESIQHQFVWDDLLVLTQAGRMQTLASLPGFVRQDYTTLTGGAIEGHYFRAGLAASLALDTTLWGLHPGLFHLTNILLHAAVTLLVWALVRSLGCSQGMAALTSVLFALHPAHVEAVGWVSGRVDVLLTLCVLGCVLLYRRWVSYGWGNAWGVAALALHGLALLCKESAIVIPVLLMASDGYDGHPDSSGTRIGRTRPLLRSLPFWGVSLAFFASRLPALRAFGGTGLSLGDLWQRVPGSLETLGRYFALTLVPAHMQPIYALPRPTSIVAPWPALGLLLAALLPFLVVVWWRRHRPAALGVLWFIVCAAPVLDLVPISAREMGLTDRYLYLPSLGICLALAWWIGRGMRAVAEGMRARRLLAWVAVGLLIFGYSWSLVRYLPVWRDEVALYGRMVAVAPDSVPAQFNYGLALLRAGKASLARPRLERAVQLAPNFGRPRAILALLLVSQGKTDEGFRLFDTVLRIGSRERDTWVSLATAYGLVGRWRDEILAAQEGLRRFPEDPQLALRLANALEQNGPATEAATWYRRALAVNPALAEAEEGLARLSLRAGDLSEGERHLLRSLAIAPDRPQPLRELALLREAQGNRTDSLELWREVLSLAPNGTVIREAVAQIRRLEGAAGNVNAPANKGQNP